MRKIYRGTKSVITFLCVVKGTQYAIITLQALVRRDESKENSALLGLHHYTENLLKRGGKMSINHLSEEEIKTGNRLFATYTFEDVVRYDGISPILQRQIKCVHDFFNDMEKTIMREKGYVV